MGWFLQSSGNNNNGRMTCPTCRDSEVDFFYFMTDLYHSNMRRRTISLVLPNSNNTRLYPDGSPGGALGTVRRITLVSLSNHAYLRDRPHFTVITEGNGL